MTEPTVVSVNCIMGKCKSKCNKIANSVYSENMIAHGETICSEMFGAAFPDPYETLMKYKYQYIIEEKIWILRGKDCI